MKSTSAVYIFSAGTAAYGAETVVTATHSLETIIGMAGIVIGALCAIITVYINLHFKKKNFELAKKAHSEGIKINEL